MKIIIVFMILFPNILGGNYTLKTINIPIIYDLVTVTTYTNSARETDSTPNITASGRKLDSLNPRKHRIIAISRDLKKKYKFGSKVKVMNAGAYSGVYVVEDVMNKRFKNRIDILINPDDEQTKLYNVKIIKN
jgi:3D (Asp-Asp-Asp) domain-containing protein